jgi:hypothetical protein
MSVSDVLKNINTNDLQIAVDHLMYVQRLLDNLECMQSEE